MELTVAVVLYNPDDTVKANILSYTALAKKIYLIDNSTCVVDWIDELRKHANIEYLSMHGNQGIAAALNTGARQAIKDGAEFLMTMDQDSRFSPDVFKVYIDEAWKIFMGNDKVAVCGINYDGYSQKTNSDVEVADEVITSGMIIRLDVMKKVGFFIEELFIDYVDYEYCYRIRKNGYVCMMINKCKLQHQIGGMNPIVKYGIHFKNHNEHNSVRQYYMARNAIYVIAKYPLQGIKWIKNLIKAPIKILLVEDYKTKKYKAILKDSLMEYKGNMVLLNDVGCC